MASTETPEKKWYNGNCHCAAIKFKALIPSLDEHVVRTCNCSICSRNGYMHVYLPRKDVVYLRGEDSIRGYYFNEKRVEHKFCPNCGSSVGIDPHGNYGTSFVSVNVRMLQDVELDQLKIETFDGKNKLPPPYNPE
ncbi:MAG: hypothetical protein Q9225_000594 [Loekoesia sp. 1 TL-2023]